VSLKGDVAALMMGFAFLFVSLSGLDLYGGFAEPEDGSTRITGRTRAVSRLLFGIAGGSLVLAFFYHEG